MVLDGVRISSRAFFELAGVTMAMESCEPDDQVRRGALWLCLFRRL